MRAHASAALRPSSTSLLFTLCTAACLAACEQKPPRALTYAPSDHALERDEAARIAKDAPSAPPAASIAPVPAQVAPSQPSAGELTATPSKSINVPLDGALGSLTSAPSEPRDARNKRELRELRELYVAEGAVGLGSIGTIGRGPGGGESAMGYGRGAMAVSPARAMPMIELNTEAYAHIAESGFVHVKDTPLSTFSIDVDTASYSNVRRMLRDGQLPPPDAVRVEEMINYFDYADAPPTDGQPIAIHSEVTEAPWAPEHRLVRIALRARDIAQETSVPRNLVFLVDVSGSMASEDKLPLLKRGLGLLARDLRARDSLAIVVYAGASGLALPATSGAERDAITGALANLEAGGSTHGAAGIELAYQVAQEHFVKGGVNRVILATDGDFNVGVTSEGELTRLIEEKRKSGVFLTVLGFGRGNLKDSAMEALADKGNGNYAYIDSIEEAHKVLVRQAGSTLVTVAKDVKVQVEWNPAHVASYRLIGYENRKLADRDFADDTKDAGEMGAGHRVTALYDVTLRAASRRTGEVPALRYQGDRALTAAAASSELLTVKVRYKLPEGRESALLSRTVQDEAHALSKASPDMRLSVAVAGFGMLLRGSEHKGRTTLALVRALAQSATAVTARERMELLDLMDAAGRLGLGS